MYDYEVAIIDGERMVATHRGLRFEWMGLVGWFGGTYIDVFDGDEAIYAINTSVREPGPMAGFRAPFSEEVFRKNVDEWLKEGA